MRFPADVDAARYLDVRSATLALVSPLTAEDMMLQSMPDASPTKWHLAHTTWFFETFLCVPSARGYPLFNPHFNYLFNSYYDSVGGRHPRPARGLLSRPSCAEVHAYREHVDNNVMSLLREGKGDRQLSATLEVGIHHEQQHQELLLTDLKHAFFCNSLRPAYAAPSAALVSTPPKSRWVGVPEGIHLIGHRSSGFAFDNESPSHRVFLEPFEMASHLVTCGEYLEFIEDGGYRDSRWWLSEGWEAVCTHGWDAPLYWEMREGEWWLFSLGGMRRVARAEPVCHVSYYEADAYARWAKARLPTEAEWEVCAGRGSLSGSFVESRRWHPTPAAEGGEWAQLFGEVWQWTQSAYLPYPGFQPAPGALGEYNGKFMCNQMVLRGGSCVSPKSHLRHTYRNFFPASARWQFSGIRLARSVAA